MVTTRVPSDILQQEIKTGPALVCGEIGLVRCLGAAGIPIFTGTEESENAASYSRYSSRQFVFSSYESQEFIQELCELGEKLNYRPVLLTYDDRLIRNISQHRDKLLEYYRFLLPNRGMVENLLDKQKFIDLARDYNLPTPVSLRITNPGDLKLVSSRLKKPYLMKPLYRHHWFADNFTDVVGSYQKAFVCSSVQELKILYGRISQINPQVVVQEYIEGPDDHMYDINMYIDAGGEIRGIIVAQKLRVFPPTAGYGSYVVTVEDREILDLSKEIAKKLKLVGLVNIQFKRDRHTAKPRLIEIHTRTSIFDILGIKAGMNLAAIYYADMYGMDLPENGTYKRGVKYLNIERDLRLFLKHRKNYGLTFPQVARSYMGSKVIDGYSIMDPLPAVMHTWEKIRSFFKSINLYS